MGPKELLDAIKQLKPNEKKQLKKALQIEDVDADQKLKGETDEDFAKRLAEEARLVDIKYAQAKALGEINSAIQIGFDLEEKYKKQLDEIADAFEALKNLEEELAIARMLNDDKAVKQYEQQIKIIKAREEEQLLIQQKIDKLKEERGEREKNNEIEQEHFEYLKGEFEDLGTKIGLYSSGFNRTLKFMTKMEKLRTEKPEQFREALADTFSFANLAGAAIYKLAESFVSFSLAADRATSQFAAQTGAGRGLAEQVSNVGSGFRNLGIGAEDAGKAAGALFDNFTGFMQMNKQNQEELMQTVAALEKIGVDGAAAAKSLNILTKNFGLSVKGATKLTKQLSIMGTELGISSKKMVDGFNAASKTLAVYGKKSIEVFSDIAAQAKAAAVETSTLLGIAEKFDTFSGAADIAGKLNAILGSQLSTTELLTMKENERIEAIIKTMQLYGGTFSSLDRFTQKSLAAAVGISDLAEAQRVFGMSLSDYRKGLRMSQSEKEFNKRLKESMDVMKKLEKIGQQFAINFTPALEIFSSFLQKILDFNQETDGVFLKIVGIVFAFTLFGKALAFLLPFLPMLGGVAAGGAGGLSLLGGAAGANAASFAKGGLSLILFATGVAALIGAFGMLATSGLPMEGGALFSLMAGFAGGMVALAGASAAIAVLGKALSGPQFKAFAIGVGAMSLALGALGGTLAGVLGMMSEKKLKALGEIFSGMGDMMVNFEAEAFIDAGKFLKSVNDLDASIKPVLGDLALIATGQTAQSLTTSATNYDFSQFTAKLENVFKPQVIIQLDGEVIAQKTKEKIDKQAQKQ